MVQFFLRQPDFPLTIFFQRLKFIFFMLLPAGHVSDEVDVLRIGGPLAQYPPAVLKVKPKIRLAGCEISQRHLLPCEPLFSFSNFSQSAPNNIPVGFQIGIAIQKALHLYIELFILA